MKEEEKEELLENEFGNEKSNIFAKMLYKNKKDFTLGTMEIVLSFIWNPEGKSLQASPLFLKFREHVTSEVDEQFLSKEIIELLRSITRYRNKAAHVEVVSSDMVGSFEELSKHYLNVFLNALNR